MIQHDEDTRPAMPRAVTLHSDLNASELRPLVRWSKDASQARRLPAPAAVYGGSMRSEAARLGDVTTQIVRPNVYVWRVLGFNVTFSDSSAF